MSALYLALPLAFAVGLVLWRIWPMLHGRRRPKDTLLDRADRWNRYVKPLLEKTLTEELLVATMMVFDEAEGEQRSMSTWSRAPSILPQTDYVALARVNEAEEIEVVGVISLNELRALCQNTIQDQMVLGHLMWICLWPDDLDLNTLAKDLLPIEQFRGQTSEK